MSSVSLYFLADDTIFIFTSSWLASDLLSLLLDETKMTLVIKRIQSKFIAYGGSHRVRIH